MADPRMIAQIIRKPGFIAALDQSGGSTLEALKLYGIQPSDYTSEAEMFRLMHEVRVRIITAPVFNGNKVIGTILFEQTMDGEVKGRPVPTYLWQERCVVPFVKVDKGLEAESDGVSLMKDIPKLNDLLERAVKLGIAGTKMRSTIRLPDEKGIALVVRQQFEVAERIAAHDLMPILEPEVLIRSPEKARVEAILRDELKRGLDALPVGRQVMLKLTIPDQTDFYLPLIEHPCVARVVALSGGDRRRDACEKLARNHKLIGSFSRAFLEDLKQSMSDAEFNAALGISAQEIYAASVDKQ